MAERFKMLVPVMDHLADDDGLLEEIESRARSADWEDCIARAGGSPLGEPEVRREPNPTYGRVITDQGGDPLLGDDGEPLVDHVKLYLFVEGPAERNG